jgi:RecA-family ATPase
MSKAITVNELLSMETREAAQIWGPAICEFNIAMVFGDTGLGKSRLSYGMAYVMAAGGKLLAWEVSRPRKVLLVDTELTLNAIQRRIRSYAKSHPYSPKGENLRVLTREQCGERMWNISDPADQKKYNREIADADVIIFDNLLGCMFPMNSRDDEVSQWERVARWLYALRETGRTVIIVHHTGKSGDYLGSSVKTTLLDTNIELRPPAIRRPVQGTEFELHFRKTRDVKRADALPLHCEYVEDDMGISRWYWRHLETGREAEVSALKAEGASKREVAKALGLSLKEVGEAWSQEELNV